MSTESKDLINLVEKLRQEQEFVLFYKTQIRQGVQELNRSCDNVFHSLWLSHTLSYSLRRVVTHNLHCYEWSLALDQELNVEFVNASKVLQSHTHVDQYSKFLGAVLSDPKVLAEVLHIAESEGLDCHWLINDLMSVVFGHCIFKKDHTHFLCLIRELIRQHVKFCDSPKDLFGGVESVFNKVLAEYCSQLIELKTFLTELLQESIMEVLSLDDYLEYDVNKAGSRYQSHSEQAGTLVDTSTFLFGEDLDISCEQLARLATMIVEKLSRMTMQFPLSLKWLLSSLKSIAKSKWPGMSQSELRRLTSDAMFGSILSAAIVNPDTHAIVESSVVIGSVARYNLTQVTAVLQRSAWNMDKHSISKVIKKMDMGLYFSVVDSLDGGYGDDLPDLPSSLPGLKRSSFLASQTQLNSLVGLVATLLTNREGSGSFHSRISDLLSTLPHSLIDMASIHPYSINHTPVTHTHPPTLTLHSETSGKKAKLPDGNKTTGRTKKRGSVANSTLVNVEAPPNMPRSKSIGTFVSMTTDVKGGTNDRASTRLSPPVDPAIGGGFMLPTEVLILPFFEEIGQDLELSTQWDFHLLSEEEFLGPPPPTSPINQTRDKEEQPSPDNSLSSVDMATTSGPSTVNPVDLRPLKLTPAPLKQQPSLLSGGISVKDLISQIEEGKVSRARSNTLPYPKSPTQEMTRGLMSEGGTPMYGLSPSKGAWLGGEPMMSPVMQEDDSVISSPSYDRLAVVTSTYVPSAESSLTNSPTSPGFIELAGSPVNETTPTFVSNGQATPTAVTSPVQAIGEMSHDLLEIPCDVTELTNGMDRSSAENLSGDESEFLLSTPDPIIVDSPSGKKKKRRKFWPFRKHKSVEASAKPEPSRKSRSKSEVGLKVTLESSLDVGKVRSRSEHDVLEEPRQSVFRNRRSYTLLTGDITAKYAALEKVKRKKTPSTQDQITDDVPIATEPEATTTQSLTPVPKKLDRFDNTPPAEMSPRTFQKSLYCDQLKYKLRAALQNIHTPLSLSPVYLQLKVDQDSKCDTRYQLLLLIQHSLQRSRWKHDSMDVALLTEILKMVEPLSNELVQSAVDGVYNDYYGRSAYIAYLVKSQQKFQDAKLQVAALQSSVDRIKDTERDLFVSFATQLFLESRDLQLKQFSQDMSILLLADEKCSLMDRYQLVLGEAIKDDPTWLCWGDMEGVVCCLDDHLFAHVYEHIFHPNGDSDTMRDQIFSQHLSHLSETISVTHQSLQIPIVYHSSCPWSSAQTHLRTMTAYKSPRGKLQCIVRTCKILISLLQFAKCGDPPGADDMFPVIVYVLIKSNPPSLLSTVQFIKNFIELNLAGEDAYWWAQFSTAVEFTKTLE